MDITKLDFKPILENARMSEQGFAELLRIIQPYVIYKAKSTLGSAQDAEDVYQMVSLGIYRNFDNINPNAFMSYLKTAVTNTCNDFLRKRHKLTDDGYEINSVEIDAYEDWDIPDTSDSAIDLTAEYRTQIVNEVINSLPEVQREVIVLRYIDDMKIKDIAVQLNENESTIKSRIYAAHKNIEEAILKIQKRDDINLYSYSPFLFFLLLFRRNYEAQIPDSLLLERSMRSVKDLADSSKTAIRTAETIKTTIDASSAINTATAAKATAAAATKTGISAGAKVLIGILATAVVAGGGIFGYNAVQNKKKEELKNRYLADHVAVTVDIDSNMITVGETTTIDVQYESNEDLEYTVTINPSSDFVTIDGNTIQANKSGEGRIDVLIAYPDDGKEKRRVTVPLSVVDKENMANSLGLRMKQYGYTTQHIFQQDLPSDSNGRTIYIQYSDFSWDDFETSYSEWAKQPFYDPKVGDYLGTKGANASMYGMYSFKYFDSTCYPSYINIDLPYVLHNSCGFQFTHDEDTIYGKSTYFGLEDNEFKYDEATGQYVSENANGIIYFDIEHPCFSGQYCNNDNYTLIYDADHHLIELIFNNGYYSQNLLFNYENGRVSSSTLLHNGNPDTETVFYYDDRGLLTGAVSYNLSSSSVVPYGAVTNVVSYDYD